MTGLGQTLPSDGRSANDRSGSVSGSPSVESRASAERRKRLFPNVANSRAERCKAAIARSAERWGRTVVRNRRVMRKLDGDPGGQKTRRRPRPGGPEGGSRV